MSAKSKLVAAGGAVLIAVLAAGTAAGDWNEGRELYYQGRFAEAAEHFRTTIKTNPHWPGGYLMLGRCQLALKQHDDAIANLEKAVELGPTNPANVTALAKALSAADRGAEARDLLGRLDLEALSPEWKAEAALLEARSLLDEGRVADAVALLESRLLEDPDRPALHQAIAAADLAAGDRPGALEHFARAYELDAGDAASGRAAVSIALALAAAADDDAVAKGLYERAVKIAVPLAEASPGYENSLIAGEAALGARQLETARRWFASAAKESPQEPLARFYLGRTLAALDRDDEAVSQLREALGAAPDPELAVRIHDQLGRLLACRLELAEAARHFRAAGEKDRAEEIDALAASFGDALGRLATLRSAVADLASMEAELADLGDADGVEALAGRRQAMGREIAGIEANLAEVRSALCR